MIGSMKSCMRIAAVTTITAMLGFGAAGCNTIGGSGGTDSGVNMSGAELSKPNENIIQIATGDNMGDVSTLVKAIQAAGLVDTLKGAGPFTVFAPTNEAFAELPPGTLDDLLKPENKDKLRAILLYHVHPGDVIMARDVHTMSLPTADDDKKIQVSVNNGTVMLNGTAKVVKSDILASNGVIHWIDKVLMPPSM